MKAGVSLASAGFFLVFGFMESGSGVWAAPPTGELLRPLGSEIRLPSVKPGVQTVAETLEGVARGALNRSVLPLPRGAAGEFKSAIEHLEALNGLFQKAPPLHSNFGKSYRSVRSWFENKLVPGARRVHFEFSAHASAPFGRYVSFSDRLVAERAFEEVCDSLRIIDFAGVQNSTVAMNLERGRDGLSRFIEIYIERASALLEARNVPHRIESTGAGAAGLQIVILPSIHHTPLNRFADSLAKKGFTTLVDPASMIFDGVGGWMSGGAREIAISHRDLLRGTLSRAEARARAADARDTSATARALRESAGDPLGVVSMHELRHFSKERKKAQGLTDFLQGEVSSNGKNLPGFDPDSGYATYMGLDEIEAFYFQTRVDSRRLRRVLESDSMITRDEAASAILEMMEISSNQALKLSEQAAVLATLALDQIAAGGRAYRTMGQAGYAVRLDLPGNGIKGWAEWNIIYDLPKSAPRTLDATSYLKGQLEALKAFAQARGQALMEFKRALDETKAWKPGVGKIVRARNLDVFLSPAAHETAAEGSIALRRRWEDAFLKDQGR